MTVTINEHRLHIAVLTLSGRLDAFNSPDIRQHCDQLAADDAIYGVVFDLTAVTFLDSAGMAVIVNLWKTMRAKGGNVVLVLPEDEDATRILQLTKFDRVFATAPTVQDALSHL
jgi:anti-sigma B factor antagonist